MSVQPATPQIVVIGLGYVGLPVGVALARHHAVTGFDISGRRIAELLCGHDRTGEIDPPDLATSAIRLIDDPAEIGPADIYIVTVPTPVDSNNRPDLTAVITATKIIASTMDPKRRPTIVYESTVYPGVTEDVCGGVLQDSGLVRGRDFRLGYSPERINPGDREHGIERIIKVVAGEDAEVVEQLAGIYGSITSGGVYRAASIKAAEAAKAIENAQRDINIAFMNEVAQIAQGVGLSIWDVLAAARTKWNFLPFEPGLVGGHCIGVDPFYLSHLAEQVGLQPQVVLAGRNKNDGMAGWIAEQIHQRCGGAGRALILGATFKEDVPDLRNSKTLDLADRLTQLGHEVQIRDSVADPAELEALGYRDSDDAPFDLLIGAVRHRSYAELEADSISNLVRQGGMIADIKGMWRDRAFRPDLRRWSL